MKPSFVFACLASVLVLTVSINGAAISPASSSASLFRRMDNGEEKTNVEETDSQFNFPNVDTFGFEAKLAELVAKAPKESLHVWYNDKREIARIVSKSENAVETEMTLDVFWNRGDLQSTTIEKTKLALIPGIPAVVVAEPGKVRKNKECTFSIISNVYIYYFQFERSARFIQKSTISSKIVRKRPS